MNFQILPNKFKSIGLIIFIIGFVIPFTIGFINGLSQPFNSNETSRLTEKLLQPNLLKWLDIVTIFGMLIYMLSKEKIEDDYITKLRLESYQITTIFCLSTIIIFHVINNEMTFYVSYMIYAFMLLYLITFSLKKRFVL
ncbi:hypothetical protein DFQ03_0192 [Maribacter caenipelagi]|uniref:Uncharacterized protein n=1 Tax=Maribacter caenipelagi TaxID=1447781 RepID=A0A4R7DAV5_9FLAO|nr:hypothetical protein [Maribacter caenipelagi]TDS18489.1 hypothetical protein DFQ03_0192 [Maribacter caenipelagi]